MLLGRLPNSLTEDQKGRITIPPKVREGLGWVPSLPGEESTHRPVDLYIGCPPGEPCLWIHSEDQHDTYFRAMNTVFGSTERDRRMLDILRGNFVYLTTDKAHRITIPGFLLKSSGIAPRDEVVFVGSQDRVHLWKVSEHDRMAVDLKDEFKERFEEANVLLTEWNKRRLQESGGDHE